MTIRDGKTDIHGLEYEFGLPLGRSAAPERGSKRCEGAVTVRTGARRVIGTNQANEPLVERGGA